MAHPNLHFEHGRKADRVVKATRKGSKKLHRKSVSREVNAQMQDAGIDRTLEVLGGKHIFHHDVRSPLDAHDMLQEGLPGTVLVHLIANLHSLLSNPESLQRAIGMSSRTYQRRKVTPEKPLSPEQSWRTWKFAEILGRVTELLGSQAEAEQWLERPAMALDRRKPIDLLSTPAGVETLQDHLTRLRTASTRDAASATPRGWRARLLEARSSRVRIHMG